MAIERLLDTRAVAARLDCSHRTLARMVQDGKFIPPIIETYNMKRWRERDVNAWIIKMSQAKSAKVRRPARVSDAA